MIPPTRGTARRTTTRAGDQRPRRGPPVRPTTRRPAREPAAAERRPWQRCRRPAAGAPTRAGDGGAQAVGAGRGHAAHARPGQQRAAREHRDAGQRAATATAAATRARRRRSSSTRVTAATPLGPMSLRAHDLQRPLAVVSGGQPVGGVGEPVQVHRPRAEHEDGDAPRRRARRVARRPGAPTADTARTPRASGSTASGAITMARPGHRAVHPAGRRHRDGGERPHGQPDRVEHLRAPRRDSPTGRAPGRRPPARRGRWRR